MRAAWLLRFGGEAGAELLPERVRTILITGYLYGSISMYIFLFTHLEKLALSRTHTLLMVPPVVAVLAPYKHVTVPLADPVVMALLAHDCLLKGQLHLRIPHATLLAGAELDPDREVLRVVHRARVVLIQTKK